MDFKVLILGSDINAYTMARSFHEKYNMNVDILTKSSILLIEESYFCNVTTVDNLYNNEVFKEELKKYGEKYKNEKIILVGTNDHYIGLISRNEKFLSKWFLFNYPKIDIVNTFLDKSLFYEKFQKEFDMPKTFIYSCKDKKLNIKNMRFPLVVKPGDGHIYFTMKFDGQSKVYKVDDEISLKKTITLIENAGYNETLIIQEFIPGDDSRLFDSMFYVNSNKKAQHASFAQIALQEHTKTGVGNCTVLLNGYSEFGGAEKLISKLKKFLESINYTGFAEFDFKYDARDNKYKLFEINPRQARCSYYFGVSCKNLAQCLVDDLIYKKEEEFIFSKKRVVLSFVPIMVIKKHVVNKKLLKEIKSTIKTKEIYNPVDYKKEKSFKIKLYVILKKLNYIKKYAKKNWWN